MPIAYEEAICVYLQNKKVRVDGSPSVKWQFQALAKVVV